MESVPSPLVAFTAGLVSFISPCILPLLPGYIVYMTGLSLEELAATDGTSAATRARVMTSSIFFVLGFSTFFVAAGLSAGAVGSAVVQHADVLRKAAAVFIALMGLHIAGILKIPVLLRQIGGPRPNRRPGLLGSFALGLGLSAAWTPCVGPVLAAILAYASTTASAAGGAALLGFYSLGLAVPFLAIAGFFGSAVPLLQRASPYLRPIQAAAGLGLVVVAALVWKGTV